MLTADVRTVAPLIWFFTETKNAATICGGDMLIVAMTQSGSLAG